MSKVHVVDVQSDSEPMTRSPNARPSSSSCRSSSTEREIELDQLVAERIEDPLREICGVLQEMLKLYKKKK